ncbi:MAG: TauD/TfdA family dioxygenase [Deltaproteobacteria bacterium]|nr:TauD/TfdA family dioxygenase [Deltaproteobacteria bacterium]MBW2496810.1 TauD/TfdA family dioxygenase [Deltaproteobacteria bacterium]
MSEDAERPQAERLRDHVNQDRFWCTHECSDNDAMIWGDRCINHRRNGGDPSDRRTMHHSQAAQRDPSEYKRARHER